VPRAALLRWSDTGAAHHAEAHSVAHPRRVVQGIWHGHLTITARLGHSQVPRLRTLALRRVDLPLSRGPMIHVKPSGSSTVTPGRKPPLISMLFIAHMNSSPVRLSHCRRGFHAVIEPTGAIPTASFSQLCRTARFKNTRRWKPNCPVATSKGYPIRFNWKRPSPPLDSGFNP
jgi:hypothetical protein